MQNRDSRLEDMGSTIFKVLAGKGFDVTMYDEQGNQTEKPTEATMLWSNDLKMMVVMSKQTLGKSPRPLISFYTSDVTPDEQFQDVYTTLKNSNLHDFSFDVKPYSRTLEAHHFKHFKESWQWTGTTRSSYLPINQVKVVIRHSRPWDREAMDKAQRWRRIRAIMLHTPDGQRFRFPHNHVCGARAMAQHLNHDRTMNDAEGQLITNLVKLLTDLRPIQRQCKQRNVDHLRTQILETRKKIKKFLEGMCRAETYQMSLDEAKQWSWDWKHDQSHKSNPEQRQLDEWFQQFDPTRIFENSEDTESLEQIRTAYTASNKDMYRTLDYLKRNVPGWQSRFEADPKKVTDQIEKAVSEFKKTS